MNIKINGNNLELTEAIQSYIEKKFSESLEKFENSENLLAEIDLLKTSNRHQQGDHYKVSVRLSGLKKNIYLEATKDDLYASVDDLKDKLEYRISNLKNKKQTVAHKVALKFKNLFKKGE